MDALQKSILALKSALNSDKRRIVEEVIEEVSSKSFGEISVNEYFGNLNDCFDEDLYIDPDLRKKYNPRTIDIASLAPNYKRSTWSAFTMGKTQCVAFSNKVVTISPFGAVYQCTSGFEGASNWTFVASARITPKTSSNQAPITHAMIG